MYYVTLFITTTISRRSYFALKPYSLLIGSDVFSCFTLSISKALMVKLETAENKASNLDIEVSTFRVKTNIGKQIISFMAIDLWQELPY